MFVRPACALSFTQHLAFIFTAQKKQRPIPLGSVGIEPILRSHKQGKYYVANAD